MSKSLELFALSVTKIMKDKKISQRRLGEMSGIPHSHISLYLAGKRSPGLEAIERIASALEASVPSLLSGEQRAPIHQSTSHLKIQGAVPLLSEEEASLVYEVIEKLAKIRARRKREDKAG